MNISISCVSKLSEGSSIILVLLSLLSIGVHLLWSFPFSFLVMEISLQAPKLICKPNKCSINGDSEEIHFKSILIKKLMPIVTLFQCSLQSCFSPIEEIEHDISSPFQNKQNVLHVVRLYNTCHSSLWKLKSLYKLKQRMSKFLGENPLRITLKDIQCRKHFV